MMQIRQGGREKGETTCLEQTNPHINREGTAGTEPETFCLWVQMSGLTWKDKKENMLMQLEVSGIQIWRLQRRENTTKEDFFFSQIYQDFFFYLCGERTTTAPPHGSIHHRPGRLNRSLSPRSDPELPHSFTALHSSIFPFSYALPRIRIRAPRTSHTTEKTCKEPNLSATDTGR